MRQDLMDILVCPLCKAKLELDVASEEAGEIMTGTLTCTGCNERYPIEDGIPNLLPRTCATHDPLRLCSRRRSRPWPRSRRPRRRHPRVAA
ncbi:MAG: methytransferase partner Trm112 [Thermoflexaceae bacterium]|nr:methytransferase partner Trm112 [Thermoflexaceae bacterium]